MPKHIIAVMAFMACFALCSTAHATKQERVATKARVEAELTKDLAQPWEPQARMPNRTCLDGRKVADFAGDIVEYWANMECPYCDIQQAAIAQRDNPDMCIVARHSATIGISESVKKALSYEALREYSVNAANGFWHHIVPKTSHELTATYSYALRTALEEAGIDMEKFGESVTSTARDRVSADIVAAQDYIFSTPTFILDGLRFPACDFKAAEIPVALDLAKKARNGDDAARAKVVEIIVNGIMGDTQL